jgi:hypothetical protein
MPAKREMIRQKVVDLAELDFAGVPLPSPGEEVLKAIRATKIESLQGLLGPMKDEVMRGLVAQYWRGK